MRTVMLKSRNKDNKHIEGFKERTKNFVTYNDDEKYKKSFEQFVKEGLPGERCRCYISVNRRNEAKIKKQLICELVTNDDLTLDKINGKVASIANQPQNAAEHKWLFDFDCSDEDLLNQFLVDLEEIDSDIVDTVQKTINGYAIIVNHGFDVRPLQAKYPFVELKRDDMLLISWKQNGESIF